jgi:hypothetical protein
MAVNLRGLGNNALKASFAQLDHSLIDLHAQPVALQTVPVSQLMFTPNTTFPTHGPPGLGYPAITVRRI